MQARFKPELHMKHGWLQPFWLSGFVQDQRVDMSESIADHLRRNTIAALRQKPPEFRDGQVMQIANVASAAASRGEFACNVEFPRFLSEKALEVLREEHLTVTYDGQRRSQWHNYIVSW